MTCRARVLRAWSWQQCREYFVVQRLVMTPLAGRPRWEDVTAFPSRDAADDFAARLADGALDDNWSVVAEFGTGGAT